MKRFFWFCAGADVSILDKCPTTEHQKYAGIGATVLLTALLASLSGGYALYTSFGATSQAILFGLFWGTVIFNLDRMIVSSMRKESSDVFNWREFSVALPRLVLAIFIAIVVAKPLELKIFEKDINRQLADDQRDKLRAIDTEFTNSIFTLKAGLDSLTSRKRIRVEAERASKPAGIETIETRLKENNDGLVQKNNEANALRIRRSAVQEDVNRFGTAKKELQNEIATLNASINEYAAQDNQDMVNELANRRNLLQVRIAEIQKQLSPKVTERNNLSSAISDLDQYARGLRTTIAELENDKRARWNEHNTRITALGEELKTYEVANETRKDSIEQKKSIDRVKARNPFEEYEGFQVRLIALSNLEENSPAVRLASWFLMLLFVTLETAPVVLKLLLSRGAYEREYELREYENYTRAQKDISSINDSVNHDLRIETQRNQRRFELELVANERILREITRAQERIALRILRRWEARESQNVDQNYEQYIRTEPFSGAREDGRYRNDGTWNGSGNGSDNSGPAHGTENGSADPNEGFTRNDSHARNEASRHRRSRRPEPETNSQAPVNDAASPPPENGTNASAPENAGSTNERQGVEQQNSSSEPEANLSDTLRKLYNQMKDVGDAGSPEPPPTS